MYLQVCSSIREEREQTDTVVGDIDGEKTLTYKREAKAREKEWRQ